MNIKSLMPQWKTTLGYLILFFLATYAAARGGISPRVAIGPILLAIGGLQKLGVIKKIPMLGNLPQTYEIGVSLVLWELLVLKSMGPGDLINIYRAMITGTNGNGQAKTNGVVVYPR